MCCYMRGNEGKDNANLITLMLIVVVSKRSRDNAYMLKFNFSGVSDIDYIT